MALADRIVALRRDPHSDEVLARGGDPEAHSILQRTGFVPVVRLHEAYHRLPTGLDRDEEIRMATRAVARLRTVRYHVDCDTDFDTESTEPHYMPLGAQVANLAAGIRASTATDDVAEILTELTATHDGILAALGEVLTASADFYQGLGRPADIYVATRLRSLADDSLDLVRSSLQATRSDLADRHEPHPLRRECANEVEPDESEASAVCACPPPGPVPTVSSPPPVPSAAARRR
ncbi:hypothetical protein ABT083_13280 [Streptomyces goshikiensis]|uniref:hypothetical protein n=1 Tax=Streptomyces goshikiensis TaxID=1942 RepID=UPI00331A8360